MKTIITEKLEENIRKATIKMGVFGCFEVTIGFGGMERVDYLTYDTKGIFRCYEIKSSLSDFNSKNKKTFIGNYNYYVLTKELYEQVKENIPKEIGVYVGYSCVKKAKKQSLLIDKDILKDSMIRSLYRDSDKLYRTNNVQYINRLKSQIKTLESKNQKINQEFNRLYTYNLNKIGYKKVKEILSD